jgi:2-desacetyl-2-hydroxyethyl bacteriochlorophyllide A dehydrogenase
MKTLVCTKPFQFDYTTMEKPIAKDGETLLKIERIGICGTDLHAFEGTQPFFNYPRILGHELAATIVETNAKNFLPNEAVTIIPYFNCGKCIACRMEKENCCSNINVFGVHIDGGMREFLVVPDEALVKSEGLSFDELALVEPLAISAHGVRRAEVKKNEFVLVVGAGPIGIGTMEFAKIAGGNVIAMDVNEGRLNFCKENLKIEHTINPVTEDAMEKLKQITNNDMPTVIIDASGNQKAINNAFQYLGHGGRFVLIGLQKGEIQFMHPEFHKRESTLMSSRNATRIDFEHVISCLKKGIIHPLHYITHHVHFDEVIQQFESWLKPETGVIKAMIAF